MYGKMIHTYRIMLLQQPPPQGASSGVLWFFIGILVTIFLLAGASWYKNLQKQRQRPRVHFFDPVHYQFRTLGFFVKFENINIRTEQQHILRRWAIVIDNGRGTNYYLIPSYGSREDMVINPNPYTYCVFGWWLGTGADGRGVHQQWINDVYDSHYYQIEGEPLLLPNNILLCRPIWRRDMSHAMFVNDIYSIRGIWDVLRTGTDANIQQIQQIFDSSIKFRQSLIQTATDHVKTGWASFLRIWDAMCEERTVVQKVIGRLMHISAAKVSQAGFTQALQSGSLKSMVENASSFQNAMDSLNSMFGNVTMSQDMAAMLEQKINQKQEQLGVAHQQLNKKDQEIDELVTMIQNRGASSSRPKKEPSNEPVVV